MIEIMNDNPFLALPDHAKTTKVFQKGEYVFRQADCANSIYFLLEGCVYLQRLHFDGVVTMVHVAHAQESFAEAALFAKTFHCDAVCASKVRLIEFSKKTVLDHAQNDPSFSIALMALLSRQVQHYRQRLQIAAIKSAEERVMAALRSGLSFTKITDLAASISLSPEATYRALSHLTKQGRITKIGRGQYKR